MGRDADLTLFHNWLEKAVSGERQIVFVTGEPGIGKTALIDAFRQRLEAGDWRLDPSPQVLSHKSLPSPVSFAHGQCIEHYGPGEPYLPILDALGRLCREPNGKHLLRLVQQYAPTWLLQMPALLDATELDTLQRKISGVTRERMLRELAEVLEAITTELPLVLVLEDLHWSDFSTLDLLAFIARRQAAIHLSQMRLRLKVGQCTIEGRAVDFILQIGAIAGDVGRGFHSSSFHAQGSICRQPSLMSHYEFLLTGAELPCVATYAPAHCTPWVGRRGGVGQMDNLGGVVGVLLDVSPIGHPTVTPSASTQKVVSFPTIRSTGDNRTRVREIRTRSQVL